MLRRSRGTASFLRKYEVIDMPVGGGGEIKKRDENMGLYAGRSGGSLLCRRENARRELRNRLSSLVNGVFNYVFCMSPKLA